MNRQPVSMSTNSLSRITVLPGLAWGRAALGPTPTMVEKASPSAPFSRKNFSTSQDISSSVRPGSSRGLDILEKAMVQFDGRVHPAQFVLVLDDAQLLDQIVRLGQGHPGGQPVVVEEVLGLGLEAQGLDPPALERGADQLILVAGVDVDAGVVPDPPGRVHIAGIGEEMVVAVGRDRQPARGLVALGVVQLEAAQIIPVGRVRDEQRVQPLLAQCAAEPFAPCGEKCLCSCVFYSQR